MNVTNIRKAFDDGIRAEVEATPTRVVPSPKVKPSYETFTEMAKAFRELSRAMDYPSVKTFAYDPVQEKNNYHDVDYEDGLYIRCRMTDYNTTMTFDGEVFTFKAVMSDGRRVTLEMNTILKEDRQLIVNLIKDETSMVKVPTRYVTSMEPADYKSDWRKY